MIRFNKVSLIVAWALALLAFPHSARADGFQVLYTFTGGTDGEYPEAGLITDGSGTLYGSTFGSLTTGAPGKKCPKSCGNVFSILDGGGGVTVLHSFAAGANDGAFPTGEMLLHDGKFFGTTEYGTATNCGGFGCGTVYEFPKTGGKDKFFRFCQLPGCADGVFPHAGLTAGPNQFLYGTTTFGGTGNGLLCGSSLGGCGVVYQLTTDGPQPVYSFCSQVQKNACADGAVPLGGLFADDAGALYGTTQFGGAHSAGTVFKLTLSGGTWTETVLYSFCKKKQNGICADGSIPQAGLIAYAGNLYGTAAYGGAACADNPNGCGVVFKIASDGTGFSVLYRFNGEAAGDGDIPQAPLVADGLGSLYGTTLRGGGGSCSTVGCGILFQLAATGGADAILHTFAGDTDGAHPAGALVLQSGVLYGATTDRGVSDSNCSCGTLYSYTLPTGKAR